MNDTCGRIRVFDTDNDSECICVKRAFHYGAHRCDCGQEWTERRDYR